MVFFFIFSTRWFRSSNRRCYRTARQGGAPAPPPMPVLSVAQAEDNTRTPMLCMGVLYLVLAILLVACFGLRYGRMNNPDANSLAGTNIQCSVDVWLWKGCVSCGDPSQNIPASRSCKPVFDMGWLGGFGKITWITMGILWVGLAAICFPVAAGFHGVAFCMPTRLTPNRIRHLCRTVWSLCTATCALFATYCYGVNDIDNAVNNQGMMFGEAAVGLFLALLGIGCAVFPMHRWMIRAAFDLERARAAGPGASEMSQPLVSRSQAGTDDVVSPVTVYRPHQQQQQQPPVSRPQPQHQANTDTDVSPVTIYRPSQQPTPQVAQVAPQSAAPYGAAYQTPSQSYAAAVPTGYPSQQQQQQQQQQYHAAGPVAYAQPYQPPPPVSATVVPQYQHHRAAQPQYAQGSVSHAYMAQPAAATAQSPRVAGVPLYQQ